MKELANLLPIILIVLVFWLLIWRPQRRRQQDLAATRAALEIGSEVMLGSGIFGRVQSLEDETVQVEIAPGVTVKVARQAIGRVIEPGPAAEVDPLDRLHDESSDVNDLGGPSDAQR